MNLFLNWNRRFRGGIYHRILGAMTMFALGGILLVGGISYYVVNRLVQRNIDLSLESDARHRLQDLEHMFSSIQEELSLLASNTLILNSIIDTAEKRAYIDPFIKSFKLKSNMAFTLSICDFLGNPVASSAADRAPYRNPKLLAQTIERGVGYAEILGKGGNDPSATLLLAYPVYWEMTGKPEGMLVAELPVREIVDTMFPAGENNDHLGLVVRSGQTVLYSKTVPDKGTSLRYRMDLPVLPPLKDLHLQAEITDIRRVDFWWLVPAYAFAAAGLLLFSVLISRKLSFTMTSHLRALSAVTQKITDSDSLEIRAEIAGPEEVRSLASTFNAMIDRVRASREGLEQLVLERTTELSRSNAELSVSNEEKEALIKELQEALQNVKTLSGLLPICAVCKKIRDDQGYWNQIESFLSSRSEVAFSHGICPVCAEKHYGDYIEK